MQTKDSVDLMNVEYADVLNLFRSLKKSESALKDKDKELTILRNQVNQLKDSHGKFRGQLHTLESVKELTVSLQSQLTSLQQENNTLVEENKELANLNLRAEELLKEKEREEQNQTKMLRSVQLDFATLKGRYEETLKAQKQLEIVAQNEQTSRVAIHNRLNAADETISELTEQNKRLKRELDTANHKLNQCDQEILHASEQLSSITKEVVNISSTKEALLKAEAEVSLLKGDISRLIHLFEYIGEGEEFFHHWGDSHGMSFVGTDLDEEGYNFDMEYNGDHTHTSPHTHSIPYNPHSSQHTHHSLPLNATEYAHLKRLYGKDPFPLTNSASMYEEGEYWVPSEAAKLGVQFFTTKLPHVSTNVIMEFLRGMNKIWLRRERRKVKRVKEVMGSTIEDLKRQLNNLK
ncbi:hypothetical protein EON65_21660 [archaeon]|nr:MAG: hypothetical protein EON65_21660 [archaeon]